VKCITPIENEPTLLASGSADTTIKIWDIRQKGVAVNMKGHDAQVNSIEVAPDSTVLVSGGSDSCVKLWDIRQLGKSLHDFHSHKGSVNCVKFNPKDLTFASAGSDRIVKYWSIDNYSLLGESKPETLSIDQISFDDDGRF
jgi:WD40 repeat protein